MDKSTSKVRIDEQKVKYRTRVTGLECDKHTNLGRHLLHEMVQTIYYTQDLLTCGGQMVDKFNVFHDGTRWVFEAEAIVNEPDAQ
ncbi:hypothetical protein UFOVP75_132 [uncultured Caudovirales phage]|uniref:Uncharacterized protein n=1 Tax=uncultured Caudovirales phage TaxID=2100421 RepID=A0A6J5L5Y5_9CAUD|nr:hypothetical protein UFOVP75_132 [uncultured Caudovirales phage]